MSPVTMAPPAGFEPAAYCLEGSCSIRWCFDQFLLDRTARGLSPRTLAYYRQTLTPYVTSLGDGAPTAASIRAHLAALRGRGLADWTVHGSARALRTFVRWCAAEGLLVDAPAVSMPRTPQTILPPFDEGDVRRMLEGAVVRDRALLLFLLDTGLRAAELLALAGSDVLLGDRTVQVRRGKGGKGRTVFFGQATTDALFAYYAASGRPTRSGPVWRGRSGEALHYEGLRSALQRRGDPVGVHAPPHRFRRTFAVLSLRAGVPQAILQQLMGHSSPVSLKHYLLFAVDDLRAAHRKAAPVDRMLL